MNKKKTGFSLMTKEKHREASQKGGKGVPPEKRRFVLDPKAASECGRIGGMKSRKKL